MNMQNIDLARSLAAERSTLVDIDNEFARRRAGTGRRTAVAGTARRASASLEAQAAPIPLAPSADVDGSRSAPAA